MATLAELSRAPAVLEYQQRIVKAAPTVENKLALAASALRYQNAPFPLTAEILEERAPVATNRAAYQVLAGSLALNTRHLVQAETHFAAAAELEPTNQYYQLNLAVIRLSMTNEARAAESRAVLEKLRTDASLGPAALRALIADRLAHKDTAAAFDFSTQLLAGAKPTLGDELQRLQILRLMKSGDFDARLKVVQAQAATNAVAVADVAAWMQETGMGAKTLGWLTNLPVALQTRAPVRLAVANAYLEKGDWTALRDFTSQGNWEEMEFLRLALAARAWSQLGMQQVADSNWSAAVTAAGNHYSALTTLLGMTERWRLAREREDLLRRLVEAFPRDLAAQQDLAQLYLAAGETARLNQLYTKLFLLQPGNIGFKNNAAFTSLLLKTNLSKAGQWAAEDYSAATDNPTIVSTYALALHVHGQTSEGLAVLQKLGSPALQQPDMALYYGVLLAATGATNEAAPFLKIARTKTLWLPEEKRLWSAAGGF
jgi:hypothetical protein